MRARFRPADAPRPASPIASFTSTRVAEKAGITPKAMLHNSETISATTIRRRSMRISPRFGSAEFATRTSGGFRMYREESIERVGWIDRITEVDGDRLLSRRPRETAHAIRRAVELRPQRARGDVPENHLARTAA